MIYFPEEPVYVNNLTLRSGTQLPDVQPPAPSVGASQAPPNQTASPDKIKYNVMAHLKKRPSLLSVYDALCLSEDLRKARKAMPRLQKSTHRRLNAVL